MYLERLLMLVRVVFLGKKKKPTPDNLLGLMVQLALLPSWLALLLWDL